MQWFLVAVIVLLIGAAVIWYVDRKWDREKDQLETITLYHPEDESKILAQFQFPKRFNVSTTENLFNVDITYPSGEPNPMGGANASGILLIVNRHLPDKRRSLYVYNSLRADTKQMINSAGKNKIFKMADENASNFGAAEEFFIDGNGFLVFKMGRFMPNAEYSAYRVYRPWMENVEIDYSYKSKSNASLIEVDQFVLSFLRQHMIYPNQSKESNSP